MDWKTTVTGIVTGIASILSSFGVILPTTWRDGIIAMGVVLLGFFAKDAKKEEK